MMPENAPPDLSEQQAKKLGISLEDYLLPTHGRIQMISEAGDLLSVDDQGSTPGHEHPMPTREELLAEIESIVYSGTKLNLDYYIEQTLDEDIVEEIYDYFMEEAESDSLEAAMEDLSSDFDELEVRLVRLKFLCEVAN